MKFGLFSNKGKHQNFLMFLTKYYFVRATETKQILKKQ